MKRNHHLKELIDSIKKTEEMIALHKGAGTPSIMKEQYEAIKARQIAELIDSLAVAPYQNIESISLIKQIINKFYPELPANLVNQKELRELEDSIA